MSLEGAGSMKKETGTEETIRTYLHVVPAAR